MLLIAVVMSGAASAQGVGFGPDTASVTYGPYVRGELGVSRNDASDGFWESPGPADPRVFFDLGADSAGTGSIAFGFDWQNGWRGDVGLTRIGDFDVSGPCSGASDGSPCDLGGGLDNHADIEGASITSTALMVNAFYAPLEARGSNARFQPFVTAGIGMARNEMGDWTRENNNGGTTGRLTRTFEGDTSRELAWSLGLGASWQVTRPGQRPIIIEAAWRYYDFGEVSGGSRPLPGEGAGEPRTPLTLDLNSSVVTIGVRIPLQRY